jgi:hypothetical protein
MAVRKCWGRFMSMKQRPSLSHAVDADSQRMSVDSARRRTHLQLELPDTSYPGICNTLQPQPYESPAVSTLNLQGGPGRRSNLRSAMRAVMISAGK